MNSDYESIEIFKGMTKYTHKDYEKLITKFKLFGVVSQYGPDPVSAASFNFLHPVPLRPSYGEKLYGVSEDGIILLLAFIDSTD